MDAERKEFRRSGLGGTDVAKLFGEVSGRGPIDVFLDKTGEGDDFAGNERTEWGNILEPIIAQRTAVKLGVILLPSDPLSFRHADRPWQLGSPDRLVYDVGLVEGEHAADEPGDWNGYFYTAEGAALEARTEAEHHHATLAEELRRIGPTGGVEIKSHGHYAGLDYQRQGEDPVPGRVRIQCAWYQSLTDLDSWKAAALIDTHQHRIFDIPRDREMEAYMLEEAERFWTKHVLAGVQPDPDGTESFTRYLNARFTLHDAEMIAPTASIEEWALELKDVKIARKRLEDRKKELENLLKGEIGEHLGVHTEVGKLQWKQRRSGKFRDKELREHLYDRLDLHARERADLEAEYALPDYRQLYTPAWTRGIK
jgi:predicted phage-related endonuclease